VACDRTFLWDDTSIVILSRAQNYFACLKQLINFVERSFVECAVLRDFIMDIASPARNTGTSNNETQALIQQWQGKNYHTMTCNRKSICCFSSHYKSIMYILHIATL
jgi:hypothetical protein